MVGYEYQVDVSVWLALDLLVANKLGHEVTLEPASHEDLEAELEEAEPGRATSVLQIKNMRLVVQAKLRTGDAWTAPAIKALLEHGGPSRPSAATRLADADVRYLLVTSAGLNGEARGLQVRKPGAWPNPANMSVSIASALPEGSAGRVAVIANEDFERLATDIKEILVEYARVPAADWEACRQALREEARARMSGAGGGRWRREEIESVICRHDGYLASSPELADYVKPTNWQDLRRAMSTNHAALIMGQSGTGKTMATQKLYEELRAEIPALKRVLITRGPSELAADRTERPVLYDISDPWGKFRFEPESREWNDELAKAFARATHDRMFVATTRKDVADSANVLKVVNRWVVPLEAEDYGDVEREQLYTSRIRALPWNMRIPVGKAQIRVLKELKTPLEIQKYFDAVPTLDSVRYGNSDLLITEAIRSAHQNSIEQTVVDQIAARSDVLAAAVVWAVLKISGRLSLSNLRQLEEELAIRNPQMVRGVAPLVQFFIAARNLRQNEDIVTYYHPRVEAGIEQALAQGRLLSAQGLRTLIECWVLSGDDGPTKGAGMAAHLLASIPRKTDIRVRLDQQSISVIDAWLHSLFAEPERKFVDDLQLAAAAGSVASHQAEIARYLLHRGERTRSFALDTWERPDKSNEWYELHRTAPSTRPLVERFVREVLPWEHDWYRTDFGRDVTRLVPEITLAFLDAAHSIVSCGVMRSDDAIAEGALEDLEGFERVVDEAVQALIPTAEQNAENRGINLALANCEYNEEYADHLCDSNEDGYTAAQFLEAYTVRVRSAGDWQRLAGHRHIETLLRYWLLDLVRAATPRFRREEDDDAQRTAISFDPAELDGALACSRGTKDEAEFWILQREVWEERYRAPLTMRVEEGSEFALVRLEATACLVEKDLETFKEVVGRLDLAGRNSRLVEIALDLAHLAERRQRPQSDHDPAMIAAISTLSAPHSELGSAYYEHLKGRRQALNEAACTLIQTVEPRTEDIRRLAASLGNPSDESWLKDVQWLLEHDTDDVVAAEGAQALARESQWDLLTPLLNHKFAKVKRVALVALGEHADLPLPDVLLEMSNDKGSGVRKALAKLLGERVHPSHLPTVMRLIGDKYTERSRYLGEQGEHPVAQLAVDALGKYGPFGGQIVEDFMVSSQETNDRQVRRGIFEVLATECQVEGQQLLFDLATQPGRVGMKRDAALSLWQLSGTIAPEVIAQISPAVLLSQNASVAVRLTNVLACEGSLEAVRVAAHALAVSQTRKALILLLIRYVSKRNTEVAESLATLLPTDHPALTWAMGGEIAWTDDEALSDLASPEVCREIFVFMKPSQ
ncbi:hypothetical protein [Terriglobus roseus]|uniref:nSTAND3 domain-containing NTPase n=1 Tax=Terriglobus roseus TaxID=392734 RepID=UPI001BB049F6|nr:hypothetical protein [Terriglobus roseus]